jgi:hypothetical protein
MNANKAFPEITLNLDRPRKAVFSLFAINRLEEYLEKKTGAKKLWDQIDFNNLNVRNCSLLLWAALLQDDESLTLDQVEKMVTPGDLIASIDDLLAIVNDLIERAAPVLSSEETKLQIENLKKNILTLPTASQ